MTVPFGDNAALRDTYRCAATAPQIGSFVGEGVPVPACPPMSSLLAASFTPRGCGWASCSRTWTALQPMWPTGTWATHERCA